MSEDDQPRIPGDYSVRNLSDKKAVKNFLKKGPSSPQQTRNIEQIKKRGQSIQKYDPKSYLLKDYLFMQRQNQLRLTFVQKVNRFFKKRFNITFTPDSIIIWKTRKMRDLIYLHFPRMLFVVYTCYICYKIQDKLSASKRGQYYTRSIREEGVCDQIEVRGGQLQEINKILLSSDNQFNPDKLQQRSTPLAVKSPSYLYQKEKEDYQEEMMKLYEELDSDYEKKKAQWKNLKSEEEDERIEEQEDKREEEVEERREVKESGVKELKIKTESFVELVSKEKRRNFKMERLGTGKLS